MKKPKLIRLRLLLGLTPGKSRRRGVAILTVLAVVSLMTVLIISFFQMAQTAKTTAIGSVEMQRVVTLKDIITNLVMAQIREATTLPGGGTQQTLWTSQPGAIRTYHSSNPELTRLYKLYSSDVMMIDGITDGASGTLMSKIENDIDSKWDEYPDMYVDLNRPVRPSASDEGDSPTQIRERLIYPIADPSRYNGQDSATTENTEGFSYGERSLASRPINGVDSQTGQLSMPVRWIYLLEDGTPGTLDRQNKFVALGKAAGEASKANPIVSRIAWWTDDESCKINVNVASIPIPWDTPRTNSVEDLWYAQHQPVSGECQHYPGHPAQTDLSAVFFPGYRYSPDVTAFPLGENMNNLPFQFAQLIWNITPFITETGGSSGGTQKVNILNSKPVPLDNDDHLYATFEELYFKAQNAEKNLNRARDTVSREDRSGKLLERLQASQFFLTTRSNSPELTVFGSPKVCMFPMNEGVVAEVAKASGTVNPQVGAFEVTMATNATIGAARGRLGKPFYFQRALNSGSRHNNFYNDIGGRNARIFKYLKKLTIMPLPGYPELSPDLNSFWEKYPGPKGPAGDNPASKDFDSSDRTQILLSMVDMMRSSNMAPGYLASGSSYDNGNGQVAGVCGCNTIRPANVQAGHTKALLHDVSKPFYIPKGSGRTFGAAEILFFAHVVAIRKGTEPPTGTNIVPQNPDNRQKWLEPKGAASLVQLGVMMNAFSPRQGWAPLYSESGLNISNKMATSLDDARTNASATIQGIGPFRHQAPFTFAQANPETPFFLCGPVDYVYATGAPTIPSPNGTSPPPGAGDPPIPLPPGFIPWAGVAGARVSASRSVAVFDSFPYEGPGAGGTNSIPVQLKWMNDILRIFLYDETPSNFNVIQGIDLNIGTGIIDLNAEYTGLPIEAVLQQTMGQATNSFPPAKIALTSFVVPHGDYRLVTTPLRVEAGIFVPHATNAHSVVEPIISGRTISLTKARGAVLAPTNEGLLAGGRGMPVMDEKFAPHFAPVNKADLCNPSLGTMPNSKVFAVASSSSVPNRVQRMAHGRRDGQTLSGGLTPNRGSSDPLETGDFDNGVGLCPDGAYMNQPDDGDARDVNYPYYQTLDKKTKVNPAAFSPNRLFRSPVDFGSIPSGLQVRVPWQTLRFRPDPGMGESGNIYKSIAHNPSRPSGYDHYFPFANYCGPKDHLLLDMFWMPIVEPWSISEGFATKGLINLNQQIFPFTYIKRTTALHALMRSERMMAIPDSAANNYKDGSSFPDNAIYRHWINAKETLKQLTDFRWKGQDAQGFTLPFNSFRSASEICELWLVPEKNSGGGNTGGGTWDLQHIWKDFWKSHRLTGDNMRERPYSNLYPRVTVRSNVYKVHMISQTLKQASTNDPDTFTTQPEDGENPDIVTAEWRGSALIERVINPNEPELQNFDYAPTDTEVIADPTTTPFLTKLDNFYTYRVTEVKQFTE